MKLFSMTDIGKKRELNEDYVYTSGSPIGNLPNLLIVADGMGGHNAGDYASSHTVNKVVEAVREDKEEQEPQAILQKAIQEANAYIYQRSKADISLRGMGTTLVIVTCKEDTATVANVGDSRMYVINQEIKQITTDHSLVEEMIHLGGIDRETARNHPDKNIITRAIGVKDSVLADFFVVRLQQEDKLLMCTDGLTNMLGDEEIYSIVKSAADIEQAGKNLIEAANQKGGRDNIAVVLAEPFGGHE